MSPATLQEHSSVETFFNVVETETLALFEHLSFEFLEEFDVFAPAETGRTRDHEPPELMCGFLHCYYKDEGVIERFLWRSFRSIWTELSVHYTCELNAYISSTTVCCTLQDRWFFPSNSLVFD